MKIVITILFILSFSINAQESDNFLYRAWDYATSSLSKMIYGDHNTDDCPTSECATTEETSKKYFTGPPLSSSIFGVDTYPVEFETCNSNNDYLESKFPSIEFPYDEKTNNSILGIQANNILACVASMKDFKKADGYEYLDCNEQKKNKWEVHEHPPCFSENYSKNLAYHFLKASQCAGIPVGALMEHAVLESKMNLSIKGHGWDRGIAQVTTSFTDEMDTDAQVNVMKESMRNNPMCEEYLEGEAKALGRPITCQVFHVPTNPKRSLVRMAFFMRYMLKGVDGRKNYPQMSVDYINRKLRNKRKPTLTKKQEEIIKYQVASIAYNSGPYQAYVFMITKFDSLLARGQDFKNLDHELLSKMDNEKNYAKYVRKTKVKTQWQEQTRAYQVPDSTCSYWSSLL